jgi:hypothetical protein
MVRFRLFTTTGTYRYDRTQDSRLDNAFLLTPGRLDVIRALLLESLLLSKTELNPSTEDHLSFKRHWNLLYLICD